MVEYITNLSIRGTNGSKRNNSGHPIKMDGVFKGLSLFLQIKKILSDMRNSPDLEQSLSTK